MLVVSQGLLFNTLAFQWPMWAVAVATVLFLAICVIMVLTVLIQKPQGGGLASAFGGGASAGQTAFGTKTGDALTVFTIAVFVLYLMGAITLNYAARPQIAGPIPDATGTGSPLETPADSGATPPGTPTDQAPATTPTTDPAAPAATPPTTPPTTPGTTPPNTPPASPTPGNPAPAPANPEPKTNPGR